jgi:hypothetical protein
VVDHFEWYAAEFVLDDALDGVFQAAGAFEDDEVNVGPYGEGAARVSSSAAARRAPSMALVR